VFGQDLRYAVRQLRISPGFTLTAIFMLALGIGALTTVATWINAVLFNAWPQVHDARSLQSVSATVLGGSGHSVHDNQVQSTQAGSLIQRSVMTVFLAGITPARRAANIEPMQALRNEQEHST
jgi:ABC-type lipoprotein release transport system permease subunit